MELLCTIYKTPDGGPWSFRPEIKQSPREIREALKSGYMAKPDNWQAIATAHDRMADKMANSPKRGTARKKMILRLRRRRFRRFSHADVNLYYNALKQARGIVYTNKLLELPHRDVLITYDGRRSNDCLREIMDHVAMAINTAKPMTGDTLKQARALGYKSHKVDMTIFE